MEAIMLGLVVVLVSAAVRAAYEKKLDDCPFIKKTTRIDQHAWDQIQEALRKGKQERGVDLKICQVYDIQSPHASSWEKKVNIWSKPNISMLFHGTTSDAVISIVCNGFRLPPKSHFNMYGAGIYFARHPQKSFDYTGLGGYILVCDVALGVTKKVHTARPSFDPSSDLNKSSWGFWSKKCHSVHAPAGAATVSDEYVIYDPLLALPRYLISVKEK